MLYTWYKAEGIDFHSLAENSMFAVPILDKKIGLLKRADKILAFSAVCPHAGANLCEGWLDAQARIVCPLHSYRFDPANGRNTSGEGYKLKTYPVEIREGFIYIGIL